MYSNDNVGSNINNLQTTQMHSKSATGFSTNRLLASQENDLQTFVSNILGNWRIFLLSITITLSAALLYIKYKTPTFKINAKLLVNDEKKTGGLMGQNELLGDLTGLIGSKSSVDNEAEILKTRYLMEQVINRLNANVTYFSHGTIKDVEIPNPPFLLRIIRPIDSIQKCSFELHLVRKDVIDIFNKEHRSQVKLASPFYLPSVGIVEIIRNLSSKSNVENCFVNIRSVDDQVADYMKRLQVSVTNKQVSTIDLAFEYSIPGKGEHILQTLIKAYVDANLEDKNRVADSTIGFIDSRLRWVGEELTGVEGEIQNFKQQNKLADISEQSKLLINENSSNLQELAKVETRISILDAIEEYLKGKDQKRVLPTSVIPDDPIFAALIDRYNSYLIARDRQLLSQTETNPYLENLDSQIAGLRGDILSNLQSTRTALRITKSQIAKKSTIAGDEIRKVPVAERAYLNLARQQQIKQELYIFLLQKREETAISKRSNIPISKVIDPPKADSEPLGPKKLITFLIALIIGLATPFSLLYLREFLNIRISNKEDVIARTEIPVIGEIGHSASSEPIVVGKESRTAISEQFRSLRTNLSFFMKPNKEKTILLTSSMSGEGKSFLSINLAITLAIAGKRVLIMELDLRKPNISFKLNISNNLGFTNYIIDESIELLDIIKSTTVHENLFILPSGPIPPNPAELIINVRTENLMEELYKQFDYIIIDAPPIGLVTDAQLLSRYSDLTLYVIRLGFTYKKQIEIPNDIINKSKMKKVSILINDINERSTYGYGYGYYSGYSQERLESSSLLSRIKKLIKSAIAFK